jgi:hypothetical protein
LEKIPKRCRIKFGFTLWAFLLLYSGSFFENFKFWIRINQLWGILFPELGGKIYLTAQENLQMT